MICLPKSQTANAIYQNLQYMEYYNPDYVLILGGDHIYKMDYEVMLEFHKENNADITIYAYLISVADIVLKHPQYLHRN